jgi:hypothetical protein
MPSRHFRHRNRAFRAQQHRCCYCGVLMWTRSPEDLGLPQDLHEAARPLQCTAEHLKARCDGGLNYSSNIAAACHHCNCSRHRLAPAPSPQDYQSLVQREVAQGGWHAPWVFQAGLIALP